MNYLRLIDTNTQGQRYDVTPLFENCEAFSSLVRDLIRHFREVEFDCVAGVDALGFILGTAIATQANKGFVPVRKGGALPVKCDAAEFVDYTGKSKTLELRDGAIVPGLKVLLVDDWIETGGQITAAIKLIEARDGVVVGIATIGINENQATLRLKQRYNCQAVWQE